MLSRDALAREIGKIKDICLPSVLSQSPYSSVLQLIWYLWDLCDRLMHKICVIYVKDLLYALDFLQLH